MAKNWEVGETISLIMGKLSVVAPDNEALIPFSFAIEEETWHVDVMVKRGRIEYEIHGEHEDLRQALKGVYKRLGNWQTLEKGQWN